MWRWMVDGTAMSVDGGGPNFRKMCLLGMGDKMDKRTESSDIPPNV